MTCWGPWFHVWERWQPAGQGEVHVLDPPEVRPARDDPEQATTRLKRHVGYIFFQQRTCIRCGYIQRASQTLKV